MDSDLHPVQPADSSEKLLGCLPYVIGGASFIPLFGALLGIVAIIWGISRRAWSLVMLGLCGILFTASIYSTLIYFGFYRRGGMYDRLRAETATILLSDAVKEIEFYKLQHGHYPANLSEFDAKEKTREVPRVVDPTFVQRGSDDTHFYYDLDPSGTFYFLRSVGADGLAFTDDDIVPPFSDHELKNTGLRLQRETSTTTADLR